MARWIEAMDFAALNPSYACPIRATLAVMLRPVTAFLLAGWLASALAPAQAATDIPNPPAPKIEPRQNPYRPEPGQDGKDVVWLPTAQDIVERMLDMAAVRPGDYVIDLGSGDGRTVISAARRGIRALGIEYNPDMVEHARRNAAREGVAERARFVQGDIFKTDFSDATVLTLYLLPQLNMRLRPAILKMKPGTRVMSHSFDMGDWEPDDGFNASSYSCRKHCQAYFWVVPAQVAGTWQTQQGTLRLEQKFQTFTGTLTAGGKALKVENGRVRGEDFTFTAGGVKYSGSVKGGTMTVKAG